ncbi:MAG: acetolactate synthase small subunit [Oscillospiraceae bacterium]|nr:acetolactate synthase small subunit [Oscillospiraceae bacterium]MDY3065193.1 acetolactate synthase small subunit [Oscillospiraceae bacterium]
MKYTISILVENHAGVLSRISGLFARRGFNIDSLAVGVTNDPTISRITIVVDGNEYIVEQVEKQLNKLIDVIRLRRLKEDEKVSRELVLVKVECSPKTRSDIIDIVRVMDAKVSDLSKTTLTAELSAQTEKIELFCELLEPYHILEVARTGTIALDKGDATLTA